MSELATFAVEHEDLPRLIRAIARLSEARFALYWVRCNMASYRRELVDAVKLAVSQTMAEFVRLLEEVLLDEWLAEQCADVPVDAVVFVYDLEMLLPGTKPEQQVRLLQQFNWRRSGFSRLQRMVMFWIPTYVMPSLKQYAPDLYDWYSGIYEFSVPEAERVQQLEMSMQEFRDGVVHLEKLHDEGLEFWEQLSQSNSNETPAIGKIKTKKKLRINFSSLINWLKKLFKWTS